MRKFFTLLTLVLLTLPLLSASAPDEYNQKKFTILSGKEIQEKGNIPDDVTYDQKYGKMAVTFRSPKNQKIMAFYDVGSDKPVFYFETPYADEVLKPFFGENVGMLYALFNKKSWDIYLRNAAVKEATKLLSLSQINQMVVDPVSFGFYVLARGKDEATITPEPFPGFPTYRTIEEMHLIGKDLVYRALQKDGNWVVRRNGKILGPYTYISPLSVVENQVGFVARDEKNKWFTHVDDKKTALKKEYQEIGQVILADGKVFFSGVEKGKEQWAIVSGNSNLVDSLLQVPEFIVKNNGKIATILATQEGAKVVSGKTESQSYTQVDQLIEDGSGNVFAKVKNNFSLWQVVVGEQKSSQYVWMSHLFVDSKGQVFFLGLTSSNVLEIFKFHNK